LGTEDRSLSICNLFISSFKLHKMRPCHSVRILFVIPKVVFWGFLTRFLQNDKDAFVINLTTMIKYLIRLQIHQKKPSESISNGFFYEKYYQLFLHHFRESVIEWSLTIFAFGHILTRNDGYIHDTTARFFTHIWRNLHTVPQTTIVYR
jgi:hypothetical protein